MKLRELCEATGIKYDKSHADRSLKEIKKYYVIEQNGTKKDYSIIRELTEEEQSNVRKLTNCKKILKDTVLVTLACAEENTIRADTKGLLELFNIVNNKYKYFSYEQMNNIKYDILKDYLDPKAKGNELYYFVGDIHPILSRMLKETLEQLVDERLIYNKEHLMFGYYKRYKNGEDYIEVRNSVEATNEQIEEFMGYSKKIMSEYGYDKWSDVPYFKKKEINKRICVEMGISYVYNDYELILNKEYLQKIVEENKDLQKLKLNINEETVKKLSMSKQGELKNMDYKNKKEDIDILIK